MPTPDHPHHGAERFHYDGLAVDPEQGELRCTYSTGGRTFTERFGFGPGARWDAPALAAARLLYLVAGVSYYKTTAAPVIDLGAVPTTAAERAFLTGFYVDGLGEFAYRNGLDLGSLVLEGPESDAVAGTGYRPVPGRPLIPFGGGIDSIVTVTALTRSPAPPVDAALCIVHPPGDRFSAIEDAAAVTGLPVARITREIDPQVRRSAQLGLLNGHVPITAVITAAAVVAAVLGERDAVVLSNEWSASVPTLVHQGRPVNHQWSKGLAFEQGFAALVAAVLGPDLAVFSYLRARTELWVARQFADCGEFHQVFRSCNRAFHQDPTRRLDHWCGRCDKCCFIDLILAPFLPADALRRVFGGREPLDDPGLEERFTTLLGLDAGVKPFECVGDADECRTALAAAAARPDRRGTSLLQALAARVTGAPGPAPSPVAPLLEPAGPHYIPDRYAPPDLLVRAH